VLVRHPRRELDARRDEGVGLIRVAELAPRLTSQGLREDGADCGMTVRNAIGGVDLIKCRCMREQLMHGDSALVGRHVGEEPVDGIR
jgi:hypothetical protein